MAANQWDVFISHASEDKDQFVRPLARLLGQMGLKTWYDEFSLEVGDSLRRSIDQGLSNSHYGIVVLSPSFLAKEWPQRELDGFFSLETDGRKRMLPVWYGIDRSLVAKYSPILAERKALIANDENAPITVAGALFSAIAYEPCLDVTGRWNGPTGSFELKEVHQTYSGEVIVEGGYDWAGRALAGRIEGAFQRGILRFSWNWSGGAEEGQGILIAFREADGTYDRLEGGWFLSSESTDPRHGARDLFCADGNLLLRAEVKAILRGLTNRWSFERPSETTIPIARMKAESARIRVAESERKQQERSQQIEHLKAQIEKESSAEFEKHVFSGDICQRGGASVPAIAHFKRFNCRPSR